AVAILASISPISCLFARTAFALSPSAGSTAASRLAYFGGAGGGGGGGGASFFFAVRLVRLSVFGAASGFGAPAAVHVGGAVATLASVVDHTSAGMTRAPVSAYSSRAAISSAFFCASSFSGAVLPIHAPCSSIGVVTKRRSTFLPVASAASARRTTTAIGAG